MEPGSGGSTIEKLNMQHGHPKLCEFMLLL